MRTDSPRTKHARIIRSTGSGRRIGTHHADRRKPPSARHRQLDLAELGQQMAPIGAVAPVSLIEQGHPIEMLIDRLRHLALQNGGNRVVASPR